MRPTEIRKLKVENILLDQNKIFIPAIMSKNNIEVFILISPGLKKFWPLIYMKFTKKIIFCSQMILFLVLRKSEKINLGDVII